MPDSPLPPSWGPSVAERDLDALLSGETRNLPAGLLPVAGTLGALQAESSWRELSDEMAARAMFRQVSAEWKTAGGAGPEDAGTVPAHTLVLRQPSPDDTPRHRRGHRKERRSGPRLPLVVGVTAAALALAAGVAVAGVLPGPIRHLSPFNLNNGGSLAVGPTQSTGAPGQPDGTGATDKPTVSPASSPASTASPAVQPAALCREYFAFYADGQPPSGLQAHKTLGSELLAISGKTHNPYIYCLQYLGLPSWNRDPGDANGAGDSTPTQAPGLQNAANAAHGQN